MFNNKDRISINNSLSRIEDNYRDIYQLLAEASPTGLIEKLELQLKEHSKIFNALWEQRYTDQKYEDKWYDQLFIDYKESKTRIDTLMEIISCI